MKRILVYAIGYAGIFIMSWFAGAGVEVIAQWLEDK